MAEKKNYRDMLEFLSSKYPLFLSNKQAAEILGVSLPTLRTILKKNNAYKKYGTIPIGVIANILCG